jgi:2-dehydropantoate 2-reductase
VLIARGAHLEAIRSKGLTVASADETVTLPIPAVGDPLDAGLQNGDVVIIATKGQGTVAVLESLLAAPVGSAPVGSAPVGSKGTTTRTGTGTATGTSTSTATGISIVCAQNGVNNEREALRRFEDVYGICVMLPSTHLEPGVVEQYSSPVPGILDIGRYPSGSDETSEAIAAALTESGFESLSRPDIMRWKYRKLISNLFNAVEALLGRGQAWPEELAGSIQHEADEVLSAAGIDVASATEDQVRRGDTLTVSPINGERRSGGSSWQSLARGLGSIESDYLNGEIVLLGRLHGIPTPVNAALQQLANEAARSKTPPGTLTAENLLARIP